MASENVGGVRLTAGDELMLCEAEKMLQEFEQESESAITPRMSDDVSEPAPKRKHTPKIKQDKMLNWHNTIVGIADRLVVIARLETLEELEKKMPAVQRFSVTLFNIRRKALEYYHRFPNSKPNDVFHAFDAALKIVNQLVSRALRHRIMHGVIYTERTTADAGFDSPMSPGFFLCGTYHGWNSLCPFSGTVRAEDDDTLAIHGWCEGPTDAAPMIEKGVSMLKQVNCATLDSFFCMDRDWTKLAPGKSVMVRGVTHYFLNPAIST